MKPILYWHTLRHLKWTQVTNRLRRRYQPLELNCPLLRRRRGLESLTTERWRRSALVAADTFEFLNERHVLRAAPDWNAPGVAKLWLYNLHYFDWINAAQGIADPATVTAWMARWIAQNPPPFGNGWEPYTLSLRIVNWVKWLACEPRSGSGASAAVEASLALQSHVLSQRLETHLLGNHLFENAKALLFAGAFFEGGEADAWFQRGARILDEELNEQILDDGGYFELSPMYHSIILEDVLDLIALQRAFPGGHWASAGLSDSRLKAVVRAMLGWLRTMTHADGHIALFNDAALGIAPELETLERYARAFGIASPGAVDGAERVARMRASGFVRIDRGGSTAILDVGHIGPDYLPGHAHADTLGFEWSVRGQRVIVDSGTSLYADGAERLRQRGTAAHNTVVVDGLDSSEVWGQFRVARRAYPHDVALDTGGKVWTVVAAHDGYRRLSGNVTHRRCWTIEPHAFAISDRIEGRFTDAHARFHFHPAVGVRQVDTGRLELALPDGERIAMRIVHGRGAIEPATYHPEFGRSIANVCVSISLRDGRSDVVFDRAR